MEGDAEGVNKKFPHVPWESCGLDASHKDKGPQATLNSEQGLMGGHLGNWGQSGPRAEAGVEPWLMPPKDIERERECRHEEAWGL